MWPPPSDWLILSSPRSHGRPAGSHLIPDVHVLVLLRSVGSHPNHPDTHHERCSVFVLSPCCDMYIDRWMVGWIDDWMDDGWLIGWIDRWTAG